MLYRLGAKLSVGVLAGLSSEEEFLGQMLEERTSVVGRRSKPSTEVGGLQMEEVADDAHNEDLQFLTTQQASS